MTTVEELKARAETEWFAPLQGTPPGTTPSGLWRALVKSIEQTFRNIKADLARCKETMSPEDYTTCLEFALNDFIPRRLAEKTHRKM
jgi:hypothetical protein